MTIPDHKPEPPELFVDNTPYDWGKPTITGDQIRVLASLPNDVQIFHKIPGKPDAEVKNGIAIDLRKVPGPDRFSSQPVGSQAG